MANAKNTKREFPGFGDFPQVGSFKEFYKGLNGLVKDNVVVGFEAVNTLVEEKQKIADSQLDYVLTVEKDIAKNIKEALKDVPNNNIFITGLETVAAAQKEYFDLARAYSEKLTKSALELTQKSTEKALASFDEIINKIEA